MKDLFWTIVVELQYLTGIWKCMNCSSWHASGDPDVCPTCYDRLMEGLDEELGP